MWDETLHPQEERLGSRENPSTIDKFRRRHIHASDTQRHELTGDYTEDEPLRPDTGKPSQKGLEEYRRRIEPDPWSQGLLRVHRSSKRIDLILELGWDRGS